MVSVTLKRIRRTRRNSYRLGLTHDAGRLRVTLFRSNRGIYGQVINDEVGRTVAYCKKNPAGVPVCYSSGIELARRILSLGKATFGFVYDRR